MSGPKSAFKKIHELPVDVVEGIEEKLLKGDPPPSQIATELHDMGFFKELKHASLKKNLERYRNVDLKNRVLDGLKEAAKGKTVAGLKKRMNAMDELEKLYAVQKKRLEKQLLMEVSAPMLLKSVSDEVRLVKEILTELNKVQLETGVLVRAPKKIVGTSVNPETGERREFSWTEQEAELFNELTIDLRANPEQHRVLMENLRDQPEPQSR